MRRRRFWLPVGLIALLAACGGDAPPPDVSGEPTEVTYAPALDISLDEMTRTESGLYLRDLEVGGGATAQVGNEIDEFVTEALRNNLLGLPLDLATINMTRARDTAMTSFNQARERLPG